MQHAALADFHSARKAHGMWKMTAHHIYLPLNLISAFLLECKQQAEHFWLSVDCTCIDQVTIPASPTLQLGQSWASSLHDDVANLEDIAEYEGFIIFKDQLIISKPN